MTTPDPHTLNARLAEICGIAIWKHPARSSEWLYDEFHGDVSTWNPCECCWQMEIVKAWLRKEGYGYEISWFPSREDLRATIWNTKDGATRYHQKWGGHELIALAQAICVAIPKEDKPTE